MSDLGYVILGALFSVVLSFSSWMSARAYYLWRIQLLEEELALRRLLSCARGDLHLTEKSCDSEFSRTGGVQ